MSKEHTTHFNSCGCEANDKFEEGFSLAIDALKNSRPYGDGTMYQMTAQDAAEWLAINRKEIFNVNR